MDFYVLNTGFNPDGQNPTFYFMENRNWIGFSLTSTYGYILEVGTYEIESDVSMTPVIEEEVINGTYIFNSLPLIYERERNNSFALFAFVSFQLGVQHLKIEREFGKLDDALSYVGGLFGIIIAFAGFFFMSYNEYRYELFVGETFSFKNQNRVKENDFHFLMYIKYSLYDWIKALTCCEPDWEDCKKIDAAREEAVE